MAGDTGFPQSDAENDFLRVRRRQVLARVAARLRREPDDVTDVLPFDEVVAALGRTGESARGLQVVALDSIVGSVDRTGDFDRHFRPTSARARPRFERLDRASRRGEDIPPIDVYRVGELHFVRDGHHRVAVARALRRGTIEARVTEVHTRIDPTGLHHRSDLLLKDHRRLFLERVPLPVAARAEVVLDDPWDHAVLAEGVEAWGYRLMQDEQTFHDRPTVAQRWFVEEFRPVVRMLAEADLLGADPGSEAARATAAYLRLAADRYRLVRSHRWDDEVLDALRSGRRRGR